MKPTRIGIFASLFLFSLAAAGQQGAISGPMSGLVFDPAARAIRPIAGVPGAALLGEPVISAEGLTAAYVSPRQDSALLVDANGARFVRVTGAAATPLACEGLTAAPERVAYSPSGTAAALYAKGRMQLITGLPDAPVLAGDLAFAFSERAGSRLNRRGAAREAGAFAVSDDGRFVLGVTSRSVRLAGLAGENLSMMPVADDAAVAFAPGGHDAVIADPANAGIVLFRDVDGDAGKRQLSAPDANANAVAGVSFSADGLKLYVASASQLASFDVASGERSAIACDCEPAGLYPVGGLFRLSDAGATPLWFLDARSSEPRVFFVPARTE